MVKKIVAYCYEGLSNRLDTLIAASFLAKRYGCPLYFFWVENQISMNAEPNDIFAKTNAIRLLESDFDSFIENNAINMFAMSRNISNIASYVHLFSCENFDCNVQLKDIDAVEKEIIFVQTCTLPPWCMTVHAIKAFYDFFKIKRELIKKPLSTIGIHIRGADMLDGFHVQGASVQKAIDYAKDIAQKHKNSQIFICSDDKDIETILKKEGGFVMFEKPYVEKRDNTLIYHDSVFSNGQVFSYNNMKYVEHNGKKYKSITYNNLVRSNEQVLSGITDLFALAQLDQLYFYETSVHSTFSFLANFIKKCQCFPESQLQTKYIL